MEIVIFLALSIEYTENSLKKALIKKMDVQMYCKDLYINELFIIRGLK